MPVKKGGHHKVPPPSRNIGERTNFFVSFVHALQERNARIWSWQKNFEMDKGRGNAWADSGWGRLWNGVEKNIKTKHASKRRKFPDTKFLKRIENSGRKNHFCSVHYWLGKLLRWMLKICQMIMANLWENDFWFVGSFENGRKELLIYGIISNSERWWKYSNYRFAVKPQWWSFPPHPKISISYSNWQCGQLIFAFWNNRQKEGYLTFQSSCIVNVLIVEPTNDMRIGDYRLP